MKYYVLFGSLDAKVIGKEYPQGNYLPDNKGDIYSVLNKNKRFEIDLYKGVKLTDFLSLNNVFDNNEIIISEKSYKLFEDFLPHGTNVQVGNVKNKSDVYYLIGFKNGLDNLINLEFSQFNLYDYTGKLGQITIKSMVEFEDKRLKYKEVEIEGYDSFTELSCVRLSLNSNFKDEMCIFSSNVYSFFYQTGIIVSEKIIQIIEENKLKGFDYEEIDYKIGESW